MLASTVTVKGQVTIPVEIRRLLNLQAGDQVAFIIDNDRIALERRERRIEAAFGLLKAERSVSLKEMEQAIRARSGE
jgi:AbrB family looped-hinge helix DNA binding protein